MTQPPLVPLEDAQARLLAHATPLGTETLPVEKAAGRFLAEGLVARRTQPPANLSAMDGYVVSAGNPDGPWRVVGESAAGHPFAGSLKAGDAVRISTGAILPPDADAVLTQENAVREGETLHLAGEDRATTAHIRRAGFDFTAGDALLNAGVALGPPQLALAMAAGHRELPVGKQAKVCIIDCGDELAADVANVPPHQIPASNGAMIAAMAAPLAARCQRIGPVADSTSALLEAFDQAADADIIVTSGGASVGDHDLIRPALDQWGAVLHFWRIAMRPGKPLMVARKGSRIILGLPGNPVSAYVTAFVFLLPLLRHMAGAREPMPRSYHMSLAEPLGETGPRTEFVRAKLGQGSVRPLAQRDSSALRTLAAADALIMRSAGAPAAKAGDTVVVYPLQNGGIA